jgi:hypothetical protein
MGDGSTVTHNPYRDLPPQNIHACQRSPELAAALNKPAADPEEIMADLRATLAQYTAMNSYFVTDTNDQYYLDRRYNNNHDRFRGRDNNRGSSFERGGRGDFRRLHRRFGHPAVSRLHQLLTKANHDVDYDVLASISRFCHHCQLNDSVPRRFKFTLRDDVNFNYEIIVDVMSIKGKSVLHVVDAATAFQGTRFLPTMSAKDTWETLKALWIDTYQGNTEQVPTALHRQ